jgi:CRP/FNR family nitrogen fixation transcriptional regulator
MFERDSVGEVARGLGCGQSASIRCIDDAFRLFGFGRKVARDAEVYGSGEPVYSFYKVVSGVVRTAMLTVSGDRQITAFHLPGDVFGLDPKGARCCGAEAVEDSHVLGVRRNVIVAYASRDPDLLDELWALTLRQFERAELHMLLLARRTAEERLANFLDDMCQRLSTGDAFELPMSRRDIADYLGLTIETVSRTMTHLTQEKIISLPIARLVVVCDAFALARMSDRLH